MADTHRLINQGTMEEVYELQKFLIAYNFTDASGKPIRATWQWNEQTEEALKKFQEQQGLVVDGKAGQNTIKAMVKYGEETDMPAKPEPAQPEETPVATGTAGLKDLPAVTPVPTTKKVAEPINTEPKMGEPKPQEQDAQTQARLAGVQRAQQGQAQTVQKSASVQTQAPSPSIQSGTPQKAAPKIQPSASVQTQAPSPSIQSGKPIARPIQQTPAQQGPSYQDNPGVATPTGQNVAKPVVTPTDGPPEDTEMRPTNLGAEKNAEKSAEETPASTDPATISNKGEEKVPAPAASPNQMAVDQTNKALDDWVKVYTPLKARDVQPVKTFGAMLKNLKDIYSTGQEAIRSDPKLSARWKKIVADVTEYHSNPEGKRQVNEAQALADELYENWFTDLAAKAKEVGSNLLKPHKAQGRRATRNKEKAAKAAAQKAEQERQEKIAAIDTPAFDDNRATPKGEQTPQEEIQQRVTTLVTDKINSLGYDPNDVPGDPKLAKVYSDIGKTIGSIQSIVKQYEQKGAHADLVNMKEQFNTLQTQLSTYAKG